MSDGRERTAGASGCVRAKAIAIATDGLDELRSCVDAARSRGICANGTLLY